MKKYGSSMAVVFALVFASIVGCGGGSSNTIAMDASNPDTGKPSATSDAKAMPSDTGGFSASSTQTLSRLTTAEKQALCDQVNANQGGYGRVVQCSSGSQTTDVSQSSCVDGLAYVAAQCPSLTAGDMVSCSVATGADHLCTYATLPECSAVFDCLG